MVLLGIDPSLTSTGLCWGTSAEDYQVDWLATVELEVRTYRYDLQNSRTEKAGA